MFIVAGGGRIGRAVTNPRVEIVPPCALPPGIPLTVQLTATSVVLVTVAVKIMVAPSSTEVLAAATLTLIGAGFRGAPEDVEPTMPPHPAETTAQSNAVNSA